MTPAKDKIIKWHALSGQKWEKISQKPFQSRTEKVNQSTHACLRGWWIIQLIKLYCVILVQYCSAAL